MDARRDALAHRFIARTADETREWPPALQVALHQLAFHALPELVLALDAEAACRWVRGWRARMDHEQAAIDPAELATAVARSRELAAQRRVSEPPSATEIARLAELVARFGQLALALPWRDEDSGEV